MKKLVIAVLSAVIAVSTLVSCGDSSSKAEVKTPSSSSSSDSSQKSSVIEEADFLGAFMGEGSTQFIGLTADEVSAKTNGAFDNKNAVEEYGRQFTFDLGKRSEVFSGRVKFGGEVSVKIILSYKEDGKLGGIYYNIGDDDDKVEPTAVSQALIKCLKEKLPPENKMEENVPAFGKGSARFFNGKKDGFIFTVKLSDVGSTQFPVSFRVSDYKTTYGIK